MTISKLIQATKKAQKTKKGRPSLSNEPEEIVAGTLAISTNGKGYVTLGFNVHEMTVDAKGDGHVVLSVKQCRNLCYFLAKNIRIATTER